MPAATRRPDRAALLLLALTPALAAPLVRGTAPVPHLDAPSPGHGVSRDLARRRAAALSDLRYRLSLDLRPGADRLHGRLAVRFRLARAGEPVVLDFRDLDAAGRVTDGAVRDVAVNGAPVAAPRQADGHLLLPADLFRAGDNVVTLGFSTTVAAAGRPLTRFVDRADGAEYVSTLLVPMDASLAFPCFDQPDLKGRFTLDVTAPAGWAVVGNAPAEQIDDLGDGRRRHVFQPTPPLSTYLVAFAAGPFAELAGDGGPVPLRLFVRRSQLDRARREWPEVQRITRQGLAHLAAYFDTPFPFPKYDLVLVAGFPYGGMEHAGASFFREDALLFRTAPTADDVLRRATLLLHEHAHQWFGDLVTMAWFDDLWLKEGFAELMAHDALAAQGPPAAAWKRFHERLKPRAYALDASPGTTPVHQDVHNLADAKSAYGAIVYCKAPAVLRALAFRLGPERFRAGVRLFLKRHAWGNARWGDLVRAFEEASGEPLGAWADAWVRRRGLPQVEADWGCGADGRIDRFTLRQSDPLGGGPWPLRTQVLLAYDDAPPVRLTARLDGAAAPLPEALGRPRPAFVFLNDGDFAYGNFLLDGVSRKAACERIAGLDDPLLKTLLWGALWEAVRAAEMAPADFVDLAMRALPREADEELTRVLLERVTAAHGRYLAPARRAALAPRLEALCAERMAAADGVGLRLTWFRAFVAVAETPAALARLRGLLRGDAVPGLELRAPDRWRMVTALLARGDADAGGLFEEEKGRDGGNEGRKHAFTAQAARADAATKARYFDAYLHDRAVAEDWVEASLGPFNAAGQAALTRPYLRRALAALPQIKRERKIFFQLEWLRAFVGGQEGADALAEVRAFLREQPLDRDLELKVLEAADELERAVRLRERYGG